ncbi:MAG TPA: DUF418 domain-containing protein [Allosphingosinicella sp.]|nr:DUF418 domain-containing protein [Allosphingosinicella sp.]
MSAATEPEGRIVTLDLVRGVAVMGIFSVNVIGFAMPDAAYLNPQAYGGARGANLAIWLLNFILVDNKFRSLFSILFGASMLLVVERAEAAGRRPALVHYSRMAWLLVLGLVHFYLIWSGDILTTYALVGMVAYAFRKAPVPQLVAAALVFFLLDAGIMAMLTQSYAASEAAAAAPGATARAIAEWRAIASDFLPLPPNALAQDLALFRGSYAGIVHERITDEMLTPLANLVLAGPDTLGLMLLGMAALRSGFLTGEWDRRLYARIAWIGIAVGGFGEAAIAGWTMHSGFSPVAVFADYMLVSSPFRLAMAGGYAALIILLGRHGGPIVRRIAAAGRAAFTNYLGTSLVAAALFYGYGLGLYGRLDRFEAWLIVPLVWLLILAWSKPWLDRFRYGPFEWLWRSLARGSLQPMRKG